MIKIIIYAALLMLLSVESQAGRYRIHNIDGRSFSIAAKEVNGRDFAPLDKVHDVIFPGSVYDQAKNLITFEGQSLKIMPASFFIVHDKDNDLRIAQMTLPAIEQNGRVYIPVEPFINALQTLNIYDVNIDKKNISINYITKIGKLVIPKKKPTQADPLADTDTESKVTTTDNTGNNLEATHKESAKDKNSIIKSSFAKTSDSFLNGLDNIADLSRTSIEKIDRVKEVQAEIRMPEADNSIEINTEIHDENTKFPPNLYVLPPKLIRKELEEGEK